jgi:hypothetical protein
VSPRARVVSPLWRRREHTLALAGVHGVTVAGKATSRREHELCYACARGECLLARCSDVHRACCPRPLRPSKVQNGKCEQSPLYARTHARSLARAHAFCCRSLDKCVWNKNARMGSCGGKMRQLAAARDKSTLSLVLTEHARDPELRFRF